MSIYTVAGWLAGWMGRRVVQRGKERAVRFHGCIIFSVGSLCLSHSLWAGFCMSQAVGRQASRQAGNSMLEQAH